MTTNASPTANVEIEVGKSHYFLSKRQFDYKNKAHDHEDATWKWILRRGYKPINQDPNYHRDVVLEPIRVVVWDEHHEPINPQLTLEFAPDESGLENARSYARQILEAGAVMASIDLYVSFPSRGRVLTESQSYTNRTTFDQP